MLRPGKKTQVVRHIRKRGITQEPARLDEHVPAGVVDRQAQMQAGAVRGQAFAALDLCEQRLTQPVATTDHVQADGLGAAAVGLRDEVAAQQTEQRFDLVTGPMPVVAGEGVQGESIDALPRGGERHRFHDARTGAVTCQARQIALGGPAAVAIHDDRDMHL